jgi:hypothetical protein
MLVTSASAEEASDRSPAEPESPGGPVQAATNATVAPNNPARLENRRSDPMPATLHTHRSIRTILLFAFAMLVSGFLHSRAFSFGPSSRVFADFAPP